MDEPQPPSTPPAAASPGEPRLVQPIADVLANLEARLTFHRQRESFHAQQAALHRDEQQRHAAQIEELAAHFAALKSAASAAVKLVQKAPPPASLSTRNLGSARRPHVRKIV